MDLAVADRRVERRLPGAAMGMVHATLRPGCPVQVVDISEGGAQVETERPLRPGMRVHVRMIGEDWALAVPALVLRCHVWTLRPGAGVTYRGALRFEERCSLAAECVPA
jgi:PilZ domain